MRLYYDINQDDDLMETLCEIACEYDNLDLCYIRWSHHCYINQSMENEQTGRELPGTPEMDVSEMFPMNWRFLPTLDPQVHLMM